MIYACCDERRRRAILEHPTLNGIDFLEVLDDASLPNDQRQRTLFVYFIKPLAPNVLNAENVRIEGGERITNIAVTNVSIGAGSDANVLIVNVNAPGDFSFYTLRLVRNENDANPPDGFDPQRASVEFSFKVECGADFDCAPQNDCPPPQRAEPAINYLAKDYASFRQLMLDRMSALLPQWRERNPADVGVALVELLAYGADHLSYAQDAIATEAYLNTARRRVSVRRHARLVDYLMHDGCNARAWLHVRVNADTNLAKGTQFFTRVNDAPLCIAPNSRAYANALAQQPEVFEAMHGARLFVAHNALAFYTYGAQECCLPRGATQAALRGKLEQLQQGDVLIFEEVIGPETGNADDANPAHRHAVRLTRVNLTQDSLGGRFENPPNDDAVDVTEIEWSVEDALPFPLCISSKVGQAIISDVSIARGNIVLADHGFTLPPESLGTVPASTMTYAPTRNGDPCAVWNVRRNVPPRFRPFLQNAPLTFANAYDANASARMSTITTPASAIPALTLESALGTQTALWNAQRDLLNSAADANEFVVEIESDGRAYLRFGDSTHGKRPDSGTNFSATYRVGNGAAGNVGADSLAHIVSADGSIDAVRNPLAARGGQEAETIQDVRARAPYAFRTQERAVTPDDYARLAERFGERGGVRSIQRAAARFRWTGSWRTVFVAADRFGGANVDANFENALRLYFERYRMAGHDVEIDAPRYVSLEIEMTVCVKPNFFKSAVRRALLEIFTNRVSPDGTRGVFHPDNFTFGQPVYLSPLYAAAQAVAGVDSVELTKFQRQGIESQAALHSGKLELGHLEIARCDNDPNFPERGIFHLTMMGGK
jgi:hypothetical protein